MGRPRVSIILPVLFLGCVTADIGSSFPDSEPGLQFPSSESLSKTYTAWQTSEDGVIVITGSGSKVLKLKPPEAKISGNGSEHRSYFDPAVDPAGRTLVWVEHTFVFEKGARPGNAKETASLIEIDLRTRRQRTLMTEPEGHIGSPAFSPSGDMLALLLGRDFVVLDAKTKSLVAKLPNALMGPVGISNRAYIRWNPFATDRIGIDSSRNCGILDKQLSCGGVGEIELEGSVARWPGSDSAGEGQTDSDASLASLSGTVGGPDGMQGPEKPRKPAAKVLEAAGKRPTPHGVWSPGGRYYFYYAGNEGFFCREWIEGYDLKKRRSFHVRTLDRHLYCD